MNVNLNNKFLIVFFIVLSCILEESQGQDFLNTRKITMTRSDTIIVAGILADLKLESVNPDAFYFWYSNSGIYANQGGFSGNLLHGDYLEYDKEGKLILKGHFNKGLKNGTWIYWYISGAKMKEYNYKEGRLRGKVKMYSEDGKLIYSSRYWNDRIIGSESVNKEDSLAGKDTLFRNRIKLKTENVEEDIK